MSFRIDQGKLGSARIDHNGTLISGAAITRTGVFTYQHRDKDGKTFTTRELRHPEDVYHPDSVASFIQLPVTDEHPFDGRITPDNSQRLAVGNVGDTISRDGRFMVADLFVRHAPTIAKVRGDDQNAKRELSCGYEAEVIEEDGVYEGERYDHRQTNIRGNHVAIVRAGRAGPDVKLHMDAGDAELVDEEDSWLGLDLAYVDYLQGKGKGEQETHKDTEGERGGKIIGHTGSGRPVYESHKHPAHNKLNAQDHREAAEMHRGILNESTSVHSGNRKHMRSMEHHKEEHARARRAGDRSGNAIGKTGSGKEIFDEHMHPNHATFTAAEHNEAEMLHRAKFHQAQADRSAAEAKVPATKTSDKAFGDADDRMRRHAAAEDHHAREENRLRDYHLDYKVAPERGSVVLMRPRADTGGRALTNKEAGRIVRAVLPKEKKKTIKSKDQEAL